jgi:hypothetical protein
MQRLMDITNVVDDKSESEGSLVDVLWEVLGDLANVMRVLNICLVLEEGCQVG